MATLDIRIISLSLKEIKDTVQLENRFSCGYHGWQGKEIFTILWDVESSSPVLFFKGVNYYVDAPQGDDPLTFRQVLTYLGMPKVHLTMEHYPFSEIDVQCWTDDIMMEEIMESTIEQGHKWMYLAKDGMLVYTLEML